MLKGIYISPQKFYIPILKAPTAIVLLIFNLFIFSFLQENILLISTTQFYLYSPLFIPAMKKQVLHACTLHVLTALCLNTHLSSLLYAQQNREGEYEIVWASVYIHVCVCLGVYLPSSTHTYTHALGWVLEWKKMQASSMGHKPTSLQKVKETELFLHLQAATCRIFITAALRTEQSSNSRINHTLKQHNQTLKIRLKPCTQNSL